MKSRRVLNKEELKNFIVLTTIVTILFFVQTVFLKTSHETLNEANGKAIQNPIGVISATETKMEMTDKEFAAYTLRVFQPRTSRKLTEEDAREITRNMVGFLNTLIDWNEGKS